MDDHTHGLHRRQLLRAFAQGGMGAAAAALLAACTPGQNPALTMSPEATSPQGRPGIPGELRAIPEQFRDEAARRGTLVELRYQTYESLSYERRNQPLAKRAIVYLPAGYDAQRRYPVFYLMHGGWSDETTALGAPGAVSPLKNVIDNAIAAGEISPLIIVCPTYNNLSDTDSSDFTLALTLTANYHRELLNDLIPAVEGTYSTYAAGTTRDALVASRDGRGFGGFSMGAVTAWRTFQHAADCFRYFLPMSCGTSLPMDDVLAGAAGQSPTDYFTWIMTGSDDFARPYDEQRVAELLRSEAFSDARTTAEGNLAFHVKPGYTHDVKAADEYVYNALRWFWRT